jgi:hypothetical protein
MKIITRLVKLYGMLVSIPLIIFLVGSCLIVFISSGHKNPLNTHSTEQNITFLRTAAISAEKVMNLPARKGGRFYSNCMEGNQEKINCEQFFNEMLHFAKASTDYRDLTRKELTDAKDYALIAEDYQIKLFNTIDY